MPRLYMALRKESRGPIVKMLERTPAIPPGCRWGMFLRNHDELTLEMVTDEDRDYLFHEYARDPKMRLNLGIRRRLAPLLENSRRRMELMYAIVLSLPGVPFLYYGDEIGMGDNVYLGDRNGVRTPMQWSGDRNAGFSLADEHALYSPVNRDPAYHFQSVNVEAQLRTEASLLRWVRSMLAVRRRAAIFGRGSLTLLSPANDAIFAFVRELDGTAILCVNNLSRFVQPFELDLGRWRGREVVELIGGARFPSLSEASRYFMSLGPHGFAWLRMVEAGR
jgi:maltose alpha-D-glucosyltransferase/alpha-amylase